MMLARLSNQAFSRLVLSNVILSTLYASQVSAAGSNFLSRNPNAQRHLSVADVESDIETLQKAFTLGDDSRVAKRLSKIESSMWRTFQALPKNAAGRLEPSAVRYVVHNYFAKEHGWVIKGLEPHSVHPKALEDVHKINILNDQAPAFVEALLESRESNRGLSLKDVVVIAGALERLIIEDELVLLEACYELNNLSADDEIDDASLHEVLRSYLLVYEVGRKVNLTDIATHQRKKALLTKKNNAGWQAIIEFEEDAVANFGFRQRGVVNPFVPKTYSFELAAEIVESLIHDYGKWQNMECRQMKDALMDLKPDGYGRVPLNTFYSQPDGADFQFTESTEYLSGIGALEESKLGSQNVLIANYVTGPSNCIASSSYYSVCCLSDCEGIMNDIEGSIQAPTADVQQLIGLVSNLSSPTVDAPRELSAALVHRLRSIADQQGGQVHLHGRLFAQWLHFAFPNDCTLPYVAEDAEVLLPSHWLENKDHVSKEERQRHIQAEYVEESTVDPLAAVQWSEDEVLPFSGPRQGSSSMMSMIRGFLRLGVMCGLGVVVLRIVLSGWQVAQRAIGKKSDDKKIAEQGLVENPWMAQFV